MKNSLIVLLLCSVWGLQAQTLEDVMRYGTDRTQGSTRFQAMSGAMGALGGDLSAIGINPAGAAIFNNTQIGFTLTNYHRKNETSYFDSRVNNTMDNLKFNQIGGVFVFKDNTNDWRKLAFSFNYDLQRNFENEIFARGNSRQGLDGYFLAHADGVLLGDLRLRPNEDHVDAYLDIGRSLGYGPQQAFLGFQAFAIEPVDDDPDNDRYVSNTPYDNGRVSQNYAERTLGYNSKFAANLAAQFQDNLYLGASLNFHSIFYEKYSQMDEDGYDPDADIRYIGFDNLLQTRGTAFSFNLGAIAKLNQNVRIGASYQSPTWYDLQDELAQRINSNLAEPGLSDIDFRYVNVFERYRIQIPSKYTGSLALIFGKVGLLSFDYSYQDMSNAEIRPTGDPNFAQVNNNIAANLQAASTYKVGGEIRLDRLSLRGGYRFEESPYKNPLAGGDLDGFSAGLGYSFGVSRIDLSYNQYTQDLGHRLYEVGFDTLANVSSTNSHFSIGYVVNF
ncbi:OmpP1/FadL family transporter [Sediminicola luteus]|uniref:Aromatic hydrocarbon degradation protein n=1 Tax=Sediminicola luteus TaxID=319238 RepID=A0A2A4G9E5_9FLAO|nr:outer membrane protein transport protein [Sediminicola luteus]PCE64392.1 aromatic hydrocarbon degradation protein [Sediminicola luteus]